MIHENLLKIALLGAFIYGAALVIYRVFLHPLAKFPGPLSCKISVFPELSHAWKGDRHLFLYNLHQKYGPVVRYSPDNLSFNSAQSLQDIYVGSKSNIRKADFYESFPAIKGFPSTHSAIDKTVHSRKRRVLSHAFSSQAVASMEGYILRNVTKFCNLLGDNTKDVIQVSGYSAPLKNVARLATYLTFDVMGELCFGKSFGMLSKPDIRFVSNLIDSAAHRHLVCGIYLVLHEFSLDKIFFRKIAANRSEYMKYSKIQAAERTSRKDDLDRKDFFYYLLHATDPETGEKFSMNELWSESNLLIVAGSDTSSTALAATLRFLALNPKIQERLAEQLHDQFGSVEEIDSAAKLSHVPLLRACIDEAMRLAPPVPGLLPRLTLAPSTIDGYEVPAGATIGTSIYSVHRNPHNVQNPDEYNPDRWLDAESATLARAAFTPFSVGQRACIGRQLAYVELDLSVARTVFMYRFDTLNFGEYTGKYGIGYGPDLALPDGSEKLRKGENPTDFRMWDHFTAFKEGPLLHFEKRE